MSMGVYMANRQVLDYIPENTTYGFDQLMLQFLEKNKSVEISEFNGYWLDIGRPDDYMQAIEEFEKIKNLFLHEQV